MKKAITTGIVAGLVIALALLLYENIYYRGWEDGFSMPCDLTDPDYPEILPT